ncbi:MAG: sigma-70 family RNA polymerase sigma factor [Prolixibacteraceae bacterium]|nr:sigma-70 family RNA polymerase sigma factor [Prolixibacteraceae bacterium]
MNIKERILFNRLKKGDIVAFEELFKEFNRPLTFFAQQYVFDLQSGEDIVQENFIHFWENIHKIEIKTSLKAYFYQSVRNRCYNYLRDLNIYDKHKLHYVEALLASHDPDIFTHHELNNALEKAISLLPGKMSQIIRLKYIEEKKIMEVSNLLNITDNTVKTQLNRGKVRLKELIIKMVNVNIF